MRSLASETVMNSCLKSRPYTRSHIVRAKKGSWNKNIEQLKYDMIIALDVAIFMVDTFATLIVSGPKP